MEVKTNQKYPTYYHSIPFHHSIPLNPDARVVGIANKTTLFCCRETNKPGGATVHYSVNKYSEVNTKGGRLADWHVRPTNRLI